MDEQNNKNSSNNNINGFDSATNIKSEKQMPMYFGDDDLPASGYTVTPQGGYYEQPKQEFKPQQESVQPVPVSSNAPLTENEQTKNNGASFNENAPENNVQNPTNENGNSQVNNAGTVQNNNAFYGEQSKQEQPQPETQKAPNFIPNGTYSYSAARGDMPDAAFNTPTAYSSANVPPTDNYPPYIPNDEFMSNQKRKKREKKVKNKNNKKYGAGVIVASIILSVILGISGGAGAAYYMMKYVKSDNSTSNNVNNTAENSPQGTVNINVDETVNSTTEAVAKKAGPSVIGIRTTAAVTNFFFGTSEATEEGSGIIYTTDGYIITNYHVIQSAVESSNSKVEVFLPSDTDTAITATITGYNIASDLAVVKIDKKGLTAIEFADSDKLKVGQNVVAIGNPGGLEFIGSVSSGVISGVNRSVSLGTGGKMSYVQTDAAINPGNSGGALVDTNGKLVGVNNWKFAKENYEGMGFAIPSNTVKEICDNIIKKQNEPAPYIGIEISQSYTAEQLQALGYPAGAVVVSVVEGGPANEGGIQRGDIITEFNGKEISSYSDIDNAISSCKPGTSVTVKLYRSGRFYSTSINVEANNAQ